MPGKALAGVKIIEYCEMVAGPYCAKLLGDLGAEVIKVERPGAGDGARRRGPFLEDIPHPERSGLFLYLNTNKLGLTLNLQTATGRAIFRKLVAEADVLIEDRPPGELDGMGLGYKALSQALPGLEGQANPGLIVTSVTPFGQTGPYRHYKAYHLNTFHASGAGYLLPMWSPNLEREPIKGPGFIGDYESGLMAGVATLGALYTKWMTGQGQQVDISKQEAIMNLDRIELARYPQDNQIPRRVPTWRMVGGLVPCKDGHIVISCGRVHQWMALAEFMGNPDWALSDIARDENLRRAHYDDVQPHLVEWVKDQLKHEVFHGVQVKGGPTAPVNTPEDMVNSPQIKARGFMVELEHPAAGRLEYPSTSFQLSETPWAAEHPAPLLGEHNEEILCGRLGYSREELVRLRGAGII
jgi:crotonobetainyl-CoA:carnitine CoA-transferase CaiB-like acyl-CoA transferase